MENASKALIIAGVILISILLITIGIILINAGRDVTETGRNQMNSQKIQAFNAQFTPYEGVRSGAELMGLVNAVNSTNATDPQHSVLVYLGGSVITDTGVRLDSNKKYDVKLYYYQKDNNEFIDDISKGAAGWSGYNGKGLNAEKVTDAIRRHANETNVEEGYVYIISIFEK